MNKKNNIDQKIFKTADKIGYIFNIKRDVTVGDIETLTIKENGNGEDVQIRQAVIDFINVKKRWQITIEIGLGKRGQKWGVYAHKRYLENGYYYLLDDYFKEKVMTIAKEEGLWI